MSGHDQYSHHNAERKGEKQVQEELEEEKNNQDTNTLQKGTPKPACYKLQPRGPRVNCQAIR
jgi:hypothetical protein